MRVTLVREDGGRVAGHLLAVPDAARARLDFAMAALGAAREAAAVRAGGGRVAAEAYRFARDPSLSPGGRRGRRRGAGAASPRRSTR